MSRQTSTQTHYSGECNPPLISIRCYVRTVFAACTLKQIISLFFFSYTTLELLRILSSSELRLQCKCDLALWPVAASTHMLKCNFSRTHALWLQTMQQHCEYSWQDCTATIKVNLSRTLDVKRFFWSWTSWSHLYIYKSVIILCNIVGVPKAGVYVVQDQCPFLGIGGSFVVFCRQVASLWHTCVLQISEKDSLVETGSIDRLFLSIPSKPTPHDMLVRMHVDYLLTLRAGLASNPRNRSTLQQEQDTASCMWPLAESLHLDGSRYLELEEQEEDVWKNYSITDVFGS